MKIICEICKVVEFDYVPEYCCSGWMCGCMGLPIDPPFCYVCFEKLYNDMKKE